MADEQAPEQETTGNEQETLDTATSPAPEPSSSGSGGSGGSGNTKLSGIGELLGKTFSLLKERVVTLVVLYIVTVLLAAVGMVVPVLIGMALIALSPIVGFIVMLVGMMVGMYLMSVGMCALVNATLDGSCGIGEALGRGKRTAISYFWLILVMSFLIQGGFFLLYIPGVIFSIWFIFAIFILVDQGTTGMGAIMQSREYVRGYGFAIFGRMIILFIVITLVSIIPIIGPLVSGPIMLIFMAILYDELKDIKGVPAPESSSRSRKGILAVGIIGNAVPIVLIFVFSSLLMMAIYNMMPGAGGPGFGGEGFNFTTQERQSDRVKRPSRARKAAKPSLMLSPGFPTEMQATFDKEFDLPKTKTKARNLGLAWDGKQKQFVSGNVNVGYSLAVTSARGKSKTKNVTEQSFLQTVGFNAVAWNGKQYVGIANRSWFEEGKKGSQFVLIDPKSFTPGRRFSAPETLGCIAWDGENYWGATRKNTEDEDVPTYIYKFNKRFREIKKISSPVDGCQGAEWIAGHLWLADTFGDEIVVVNVDGSEGKVVRTYNTDFNYTSGLAWDGDNLWVSEYDDNKIHRMTHDLLGLTQGTPEPEISVSTGFGKEDIDPNIKILLDKNIDWMDRSQAAWKLGISKNRKAIPHLIKALQNDDQWVVRQKCVNALGSIGGRRAVKPLMIALESDKSVFVRESAAEMLGKLGDNRAIPALKNALNDQEEVTMNLDNAPSRQVKAVAVAAKEALKKLGQDTSGILPEEEPDVYPAETIRQQPPSISTTTPVRPAQPETGQEERPAADTSTPTGPSLEGLRSPADWGAEKPATDDADAPQTTTKAPEEATTPDTEAIQEKTGTEPATPEMRPLVIPEGIISPDDWGQEPTRVSREAVPDWPPATALKPWSPRSYSSEENIAILSDPDRGWLERNEAARRLGKTKDRRGVETLINVLKNATDPFVRREAALALGKIGDKRAVPALTGATKDRNAWVSKYATDALNKLTGKAPAKAPHENPAPVETSKAMPVETPVETSEATPHTQTEVVDTEIIEYTNEDLPQKTQATEPEPETSAGPELLTINIYKDFDYIPEGFPMKMSQGQTNLPALSDTPGETLVREPEYNSDNVLYGQLKLGNSNDPVITFVYDNIDRSQWVMYVDRNNNEDLTDDGAPLPNAGTGKMATIAEIDIDVISDSGMKSTHPYRIWVWYFENQGIPRFYTREHYAGTVYIDGRPYNAVAFEDSGHDGLYRESGICIDLNDNKQCDKATERFKDGDIIKWDAASVELRLDYP